jgi:uncharacterized membrane protein YkvI
MSSSRYNRFESLLLPAIVAQSMIIGGGYSTGREIVEYTGRFGPKAWLGVLIIFIGFSILSVLAFELARVGKVYDYKNWSRLLIGPLWPLFDLLVLVMLILTIAVMSAAMESVLRQTLGLYPGTGLGIVFVLAGFLAWRGTAFIERFKTIGSVGLFIAYLAYSVLVLTSTQVVPEVAQADRRSIPTATTGDVVVSAIQYVGYNLAVFPAVLFCLYRQTRRSEVVISGVLTGLSMTIPLALTFLCLMRFWPDERVIGAEVPWLPMLQMAGGEFAVGWVVVFGVVAGWTLLETAVGSIHAFVDRLERNLEDLPMAWRPRSGSFQPWHRTAISIVVLVFATLLSRLGIIDLVAKGYGALAWGFIVLLAVPLLTVGVLRIGRLNSRAGD